QKTKGSDEAEATEPFSRLVTVPHSTPEVRPSLNPTGERRRLPLSGAKQHTHGARLAQACALILAGTNACDLIAGAWLVPSWETPAWGYARAVTWAAYGAVACVM